MSRTITSESKRWAGTFTVPDYLTNPQLIAWREALKSASNYLQEDGESYQITDVQRYYHAMLTGCCPIVTSWQLSGLDAIITAETFPATPIEDALVLARQVVNAVTQIINGIESPKA